MDRATLATAVVAAALAGMAPLAQSRALSAADTTAIDAVFADYDKPASPGCMLGVVSDGALVYTRGYGRANLEHDVAFTPQTVFDIGSTSKQFLATAILLLEQDGKLSLDDDIRKYLPEVPDYGQPITIRHLLTHTSGLRDYITLLTLAGWQMEDVTSPAQALDLVSRQKGLDFQPGAEFAYSNTGFFLPSLIVERVSGTGLAAFAAERIFRPAGMHATRYMDDHAAVVPGRATGYEPAGTGFRVALSNWEQLGDGAVQTSIADLLKWDANFYAPTVGGARLIQALQTPGQLASGAPIDYGLGLFVGSYRGLPTVRHGGSWAGYRAELLRFPGQKTSVMVLCNLATADPSKRANRVADIVLRGRLTGPLPKPEKEGDKPLVAGQQPWTPSAADLDRYAGTYFSDELQARWLVARDGSTLVVRNLRAPTRVLTPTSRDVFTSSGVVVKFDAGTGPSSGFAVAAGRARGMRFARVMP